VLGSLPVITYDGRTFVQFQPGLTGASLPAGTWEWVAGIPALQQEMYTASVPTLADSSASGIHRMVVVVTAHTTAPSIWYVSAPDSGYSIDNLKPSAPQGLSLLQYTVLKWSAVPDKDFNYYSVYASETEAFTTRQPLGTTAELSFNVSGRWGKYVAVTAKDFAGNESNLSQILYVPNATGIGDGTPARFALYGAVPNPFNPTTRIRYDLASRVHVSLSVFDVSGRLVKRLVDEVAGPGTFTAVWDGTSENGGRVSTGVYFYRMNAGSFSQTERMVLLK